MAMTMSMHKQDARSANCTSACSKNSYLGFDRIHLFRTCVNPASTSERGANEGMVTVVCLASRVGCREKQRKRDGVSGGRSE